VAGLVFLDTSGVDASAQAPASAPQITISSAVPTELNAANGGAPNATLDQAAQFAWQEFIALNWPAALQTGQNRDTPAADCRFGDPACATRPLTWQTFRAKAEIFTPRTPSPTYDALPDYSSIYSAAISPCPGVTPPSSPTWVNLDETTEISLAAMYSGAGIPTPTAQNSAPQLIRFTAKANRAEFDYARQIGAQQHIPAPLRTATANSVPLNGSPPAGSTNLVSLPNNTIEIKAGWRQLNTMIDDPSHFHTTRVRYYEPINPTPTSGPTQCYREAVWGLVSLHIIQKTQSAPYFIFATFEQADNIRTEGGAPTEDRDGNVIAVQPCRSDQQAPCLTTPTTVYRDSPNPSIPPRVSLSPATRLGYCTSNTATPPSNRLYYLNSANETATPTGGYICINARQHPIPQEIVAANQQAHNAIDTYNRVNGIASSPWSYYKLINVQYRPMTLTTPGQPYAGPDPSTFYLSNSVVESNYTLQNFSGRLAARGRSNPGTKSDFNSYFVLGGRPGVTVPTLYYLQAHQSAATSYNMGGCMGCHATAQRLGGDFSFILLGGAVTGPEAIPQASRQGARGLEMPRFLRSEPRPRRRR
jgi:hypothetical protein